MRPNYAVYRDEEMAPVRQYSREQNTVELRSGMWKWNVVQYGFEVVLFDGINT